MKDLPLFLTLVLSPVQIIVVKQEIKKAKNNGLKPGFYTERFAAGIENEILIYRINLSIENGEEVYGIVMNSNVEEHKPFSKDNMIYFYDKKMKNTLGVPKEVFDAELNKEVNLNLSKEQKELLADGHDITLEVTKNSKDATSKITSKKELISFSADYSFFLGATDLLIKYSERRSATQKINHALRNVKSLLLNF